MPKLLDTALLATMIKRKRGTLGLRAAADEIGGISAPTLSRVEQEKIPDVDTFVRICKWLEVSTDTFVRNAPGPVGSAEGTEKQLIQHLRADRELSQDTVDTLLRVIQLAFEKERGRK